MKYTDDVVVYVKAENVYKTSVGLHQTYPCAIKFLEMASDAIEDIDLKRMINRYHLHLTNLQSGVWNA